MLLFWSLNHIYIKNPICFQFVYEDEDDDDDDVDDNYHSDDEDDDDDIFHDYDDIDDVFQEYVSPYLSQRP